MTYEEFKITMTAQVANNAGEEVNVTVHQVPKNNGILLDALSVMEEGEYAAPTIYLKDFYMRHCQGVPLKELAKEILEVSKSHRLIGKIPKDFFVGFPELKERICYKLVHYEKNRELLLTVPHIRVLDLAMVFYYLIEPELLEYATVLVRNTDMKRWGTDNKTLEKLALTNTPALQPWEFTTLSSLMEDILNTEARREGLQPVKVTLGEEIQLPMYVLTNREKYLGASCIFYPEVLKDIANRLKDNLYILPSSIHECIIMPASGQYTQDSLMEMVKDINESELEAGEVLSDRVYFYNRREGKLSL